MRKVNEQQFSQNELRSNAQNTLNFHFVDENGQNMLESESEYMNQIRNRYKDIDNFGYEQRLDENMLE